VGIVEMMSDARTVVTVVCLLTFLGIVFWAFSTGRNASFREAALLPFADDALEEQAATGTAMENRNG
jgi:cytochrome c oxidase cbb3-type subunit 4